MEWDVEGHKGTLDCKSAFRELGVTKTPAS